MRVVFINSIFPNPVEPNKGNFILKNLAHYPRDLELEIISPVGYLLSIRRKKSKTVIPFVRHEISGDRKIRVWHPRFVIFPRNILRAFVPGWEYLSVLPILFFLNKKKKIDLLHANFCLPDGIATAKLSRILRIPYVITEHHGIIRELLKKKYLRKMMVPAYSEAYKVIAVSENTKQAILEAGVPPAKLCVIPNGVDFKLFRPRKQITSIHKLIYVGNLLEQKGIHILLQAMSLLKRDDLSLSIVGEGVYQKELEAIVHELDLTAQVKFLGARPANEIPELISEHDALVHPSFLESFGIVVVEAMACGLPVLATRNCGSEHIVTDETGIIVPARDPQALADGILSLIGTKWDSAKIRDYAIKHYEISKVVKDTIDTYPHKKREYSICHLSSVHIRTDVRVFYKQCVSLQQAGFKVHLVVADGKRHEWNDKIIIHDIGGFSSRKRRFLIAPFKILRRALNISADAYQIHDPELIPMAILLKMISRKPVVYDIHESYPEMFLHKEYLSTLQGKLISFAIKAIERFAVKALDQAIAATQHIAEQFKDVPVVHNYPILAEWEQMPADSARYNSRKICYVGNITRERGIEQIVKAIEDVDCSFHLAGSYEPPEFRDELMQLPGFSKVVEYGYVNRMQAAEIFSQSALGVVLFDRSPNHLYSLSTKIFEYMAAGLPIMVSDLPTNIKLLDSTDVGIYIDPTKVEKITQSLSRLLSDPDRLAQWGANGKELVFANLSWEKEKEIYLSLYRKLLNMEKS